MVETLAIRTALIFALSISIESLSIISDSQILINAINKKEINLEIYGALNDIHQLSLSFNFIAFKFILRSENVWAGQVAKQTLWAVNSI